MGADVRRLLTTVVKNECPYLLFLTAVDKNWHSSGALFEHRCQECVPMGAFVDDHCRKEVVMGGVF